MSAPHQSSSFASRGITARGVVTQQLPVIRPLRIESVCTDGLNLVIRFSTPEGILPVQVTLREFKEKCRGARDSNGRDFSELSKIHSELVADAEQVPITKGGPDSSLLKREPRRYNRQPFTTAKIALLRQAWADVRINGSPLRYSAIADQIGCSAPTVRAYFIRFDAQADNQDDAQSVEGTRAK